MTTVTATGLSVNDRAAEPDWDEFVAAHRDPHHEQTSGWARARAVTGWSPVWITLRREGRIVGGAQILEHRVGRFGRVGYLQRGPLVEETADAPRLLAGIREVIRSRRQLYLAVSLPYSAHALVPELHRAGYFRRPSQLPPVVWAKATQMLDLSQPEQQLFRDMTTTRRYEVRRGEREGVSVREGNLADLPTFDRLVDDLCRRRGVARNVPPAAFLAELWQAYAPGGRLRLLLAEVEGRPVSALLVTLSGSLAQAWRIGWNGEAAKKFPVQCLYWEAIRSSRRLGFGRFDLLGFDERDARELLAGRARSAPFHCSISFSKFAYGGQVMLLPGEFCAFSIPAIQLAFRHLGGPFLDTRFCGWLLRRLHRGSMQQS